MTNISQYQKEGDTGTIGLGNTVSSDQLPDNHLVFFDRCRPGFMNSLFQQCLPTADRDNNCTCVWYQNVLAGFLCDIVIWWLTCVWYIKHTNSSNAGSVRKYRKAINKVWQQSSIRRARRGGSNKCNLGPASSSNSIQVRPEQDMIYRRRSDSQR